MKYALITGASGGIGGAIARQLAAEGYQLYLHYHTGKEKAEKLLQELGQGHILINGDLSHPDGAKHIQLQLHHPLDIIVYAAGKSVFGLVQDISNNELDAMVRMQVTNLYQLVTILLPDMISKKQGQIIVISSIWGQVGASCEVLYSTVKGAQNTFVKALAKEVAPSGIRVNAVAPGAIETEMLHIFSEDEKNEIAEEIPMGRLGQAEEVANVVSFLLSPKASYITGQIIAVNGGWY
ncbi:SDR family oxidoreductase [Ectobacillus antri]|uniref:SDR family oxidoreductase n=1 Tax=Ectobacillus antri TaxID=2486280 RepID=A0ABT6H0D2_9BACI|nr:SDR family oxidoreductase [Ectobacillus antri]MDG4655967.1 SDR family oxidoreductase [Ectobacillus antri]MDG5752642.1 SDR family oxidoreductase [Ectobacillus antri]